MVFAFVRGPFAVAATIFAALGLGFWGYRSIEAADLSVADALYRSLQLFNTDAQLPSDSATPWQLEVARFLAPLSVAYAALAAISALLREQAQRLRTRLFARNHVVVVGLGERGLRLARALRPTQTVVAIERDERHGDANSLRRLGVPVLAGDARDPNVLRAARADRAKHVVVLTGDDSSNLDVIAQMAQVVGSSRPPRQHVAIEGASLWAALHRLPLEPRTARRRVEFFSIADRVAAVLVGHAGEAASLSSTQEVLIRGEGPVAARLIVRLARAVDQNTRVRFRLASRQPDAVLEELRSTDRWVEERSDLEIGPLHDPSAPLAFVCGLPDADALTAAAAISRGARAEQLFVAVRDGDVDRTLEGTGLSLGEATLLPAEKEVLSEALLQRSAVEVIAMGRHADYVVQQRARGETPATNPSLVPWEQLPESLRESNRRFAEGIADALVELDAELAPLTGPPGQESLSISSEKLEEMARFEHDRWVRDQTDDGWRPAAGKKDPEHKLHPMLVEWEQLSEAEREKDRDGIRALPDLLARVAYALRMPNQR